MVHTTRESSAKICLTSAHFCVETMLVQKYCQSKQITWTAPTGHSYTSHPHDYRPDDPTEHLTDGPRFTRYILDQAARPSRPPPPPSPPAPAADPPPF